MVYQPGEHSIILHLAPELRSGLIKYCAKKDLDKQYAALHLLLKAMRSENLIDEGVYQKYLSRYSKTVSSMATQEIKPQTLEQLNANQKFNEMSRYFEAILKDQWEMHQAVDWRAKVLEKAEIWQNQIPAAKEILDRFKAKVFK
jgi:hypothetical protein